MNLDRARDRYQNDEVFHAVVDSLQAIVLRLEMTPSEIREAATFACLLIEERTVRPIRYSYDPSYEPRRRYSYDPKLMQTLDEQIAAQKK